MLHNLFSHNNKATLDAFIASTGGNDWQYADALHISGGHIHLATHDMILDNIGDVLTGVSKVEVIFKERFFDLFNSLVVKHYDDGSVKLMFNETINRAEIVLTFFEQIVNVLGTGIHYAPKFAYFEEREKVISLSKGNYSSESDEVLQLWQKDQFTFTLSYKTDPLRQLVFSVTHQPPKAKDNSLRDKGTLLQLLRHDIPEVLDKQALSAEPFYEDGSIKYIDYLFRLSPPELGIFELVKIRIFGGVKDINANKSLLVTYLSRFEPDTASIIQLCDELAAIYGPDDQGYLELQPHEIDHLDNSENWLGRSWFINKDHALQDFSDPSQGTLYWITFNSNPDDEGTALCILGFDAMTDYASNENSR